MGWDISLYMRFKESRGDRWSEYLTLIEELSRLVDTFRVREISAFDNSLYPGRELFIEPFDPEVHQKLSVHLDNAHQPRLILETKLTVVRQSWTSYVGTTAEPLQTSLFLRGPEASWNPASGAERLDLIWRMGGARHYDRRAPKSSWQPNCNRLIDEIEMLACIGNIKEIWGGQESFDGNPDNAFLMYQSDGAVPEGVDSTLEDLNHRKVGDGVLLYRTDFILGHLGRRTCAR